MPIKRISGYKSKKKINKNSKLNKRSKKKLKPKLNRKNKAKNKIGGKPNNSSPKYDSLNNLRLPEAHQSQPSEFYNHLSGKLKDYEDKLEKFFDPKFTKISKISTGSILSNSHIDFKDKTYLINGANYYYLLNLFLQLERIELYLEKLFSKVQIPHEDQKYFSDRQKERKRELEEYFGSKEEIYDIEGIHIKEFPNNIVENIEHPIKSTEIEFFIRYDINKKKIFIERTEDDKVNNYTFAYFPAENKILLTETDEKYEWVYHRNKVFSIGTKISDMTYNTIYFMKDITWESNIDYISFGIVDRVGCKPVSKFFKNIIILGNKENPQDDQDIVKSIIVLYMVIKDNNLEITLVPYNERWISNKLPHKHSYRCQINDYNRVLNSLDENFGQTLYEKIDFESFKRKNFNRFDTLPTYFNSTYRIYLQKIYENITKK